MSTIISRALACALLILAVVPAGGASGNPESTVSVTMEEAVQRALRTSPALRAREERGRAAEALIRQSGVEPNPSLSVEVENAGGTGRFTGLEESEVSVGVTQRFELGGKVEARVGVASAERDLHDAERRRASLDLVHDVKVAFIDLFTAQSALAAAEEQLKLAEEVAQMAARRVAAARDPLTVKLRAQVLAADYRMKREQLLHDLHRTKRALAAMWGSQDTSFTIDPGSLGNAPAPRNAVSPAASQEVKERQAAALRAERKLALERSNAQTDVSIGLGVRRFQNGDDYAGLLSVSIPIQVFDDNQGNIERAMADHRAAQLEIDAAAARLQQQLLHLEEEFERSLTEYKSIREVQMPLAREALAAARRGYERGAFAFTEIAEAQRVLADIEDREVAALRGMHVAIAGYGRLAEDTLPISSEQEGQP